MNKKLSRRLMDIVDALPLKDGARVLEIGCGPGAMAREISKRVGTGYVLAIDRSARAIDQAIAGSEQEIKSGRLSFQQVAIEAFDFDGTKFDLAVAIRVGGLDGRHPEIEALAISKIRRLLKKNGKLFIDGGNPLKEITLT